MKTVPNHLLAGLAVIRAQTAATAKRRPATTAGAVGSSTEARLERLRAREVALLEKIEQAIA